MQQMSNTGHLHTLKLAIMQQQQAFLTLHESKWEECCLYICEQQTGTHQDVVGSDRTDSPTLSCSKHLFIK